jgi:D-arabinose 1-dehydrogenase-like Zn-dependent alcohol dehydrogenase
MKVAQISKPGAGFEVVEREIPEPGAGQVRIKVQACGVCHSDPLRSEAISAIAGEWRHSAGTQHRHRRWSAIQ